jgi:hypothetical protein
MEIAVAVALLVGIFWSANGSLSCGACGLFISAFGSEMTWMLEVSTAFLGTRRDGPI